MFKYLEKRKKNSFSSGALGFGLCPEENMDGLLSGGPVSIREINIVQLRHTRWQHLM